MPHWRKTVTKTEAQHDHFLPFVVATRQNMNDPDIKKFFYRTNCQ